MIKKLKKEIKAVGFWNWVWFVFIIKRNEFHPKLSVLNFKGKKAERIAKNRQRAHEIDLKLGNL